MKKQWWQNQVAYQIYPKSFCDSNGDGIGDLKGIISKLDYLKDLGADIIWLSPIYVSPLADQGYDIADYYNIDPRFGTMEDMDTLLEEAHKRGLKILLDLVVNHCSDEHEWFKEACKDPEGKYGKYFYIERTSDPSTLCNWRSAFGGSVWEKLPGYDDYYYMHIFHKKQPDLNWENPELREEIYTMVNWWLDKGLDGFRLDAIINIKKSLPLHSYPADRDDGLCDLNNMLDEAEGLDVFINELRDRCFTPHNAFTVGEVFYEKPGQLPDFIGENGYFSSIYDFSPYFYGQNELGWHKSKDITPDEYKNCIFATQKRSEGIGFFSNVIENHDEPRGVSRYIPKGEQSVTSKKALATVYFMLKGLPWIYQGQELGMENLTFHSLEEMDDLASIDAYHVAIRDGLSVQEALDAVERFSRDNGRTPFQWNDSSQAGFTTGTPWLRVNPNYTEINLKAQKNDPDSVFNFYKQLIQLRKNPSYSDTIVYGTFIPYLEDSHNVIGYFRKTEEQTLLVLSNYQKEARTLPLPGAVKNVLLSNVEHVKYNETEIQMTGYETVILEMA